MRCSARSDEREGSFPLTEVRSLGYILSRGLGLSMSESTWARVRSEIASFLYGGRSEINAMMNIKDIAAGKTNVGYTMTLNTEGIQPVNKMKSDFSALERGFTIIE